MTAPSLCVVCSIAWVAGRICGFRPLCSFLLLIGVVVGGGGFVLKLEKGVCHRRWSLGWHCADCCHMETGLDQRQRGSLLRVVRGARAMRSLLGVAFVACSHGTVLSSPCAFSQHLTGPVTAPSVSPSAVAAG